MKEDDVDAVERKIASMRQRRDVRWTMSRHTAEMALAAVDPVEAKPRRPTAKSRRRRKRKRFL